MRAAWFTVLTLVALTLSGCAPPRLTAEQIRASFTRAQLDTLDQPLLLADVPAARVAATMQIVGQTGDTVTWRTADNRHLSFQGGVLVGTRGLGHDLMSADVTDSVRMLRAGAPTDLTYERFHSYLDGEHQVRFTAYLCRQTDRETETLTIIAARHVTTRITEHCVTPGREVTNLYWLGRDGVMWQSRQWIGEGAGYLETQRLVR